MKTSYTVNSVKAAWSKANEIIPCDYMHDSDRSRRAGYDIYFSTSDSIIAWISDLGNRLEVNLPNGESVNVWIEEEEETAEVETEETVALAPAEDACVWDEDGNEVETVSAEALTTWRKAREAVKGMRVEALYTPEVCQRVTIAVDGQYGSEEEKRVYEAIRSGSPDILFELLTRYAETHGIKWGGIWGVKTDHYEHGKSGRGHYIVSGYISGRIGEEMSFCASCADLLRQYHEKHNEKE